MINKRRIALMMALVMLGQIVCPSAVFGEETSFDSESLLTEEDILSGEAASAGELLGASDSETVYIYTEEDLRNIDGATSQNFVLAADITLTSEWTPLNIYNCVFDGGGHTIDGMTITSSNYKYVGLFGTTGEDCYISDLNLTNINIDISCGDDDLVCIGSVVGYNGGYNGGRENLLYYYSSKIYGCYVSGTINVDYNPSYGNLKFLKIDGLFNGTNCKTDIDISLNSYAGFIVNGLERCTASSGSGKIYVDYYGNNEDYYYRNAAGINACESCYYKGDVEFINEFINEVTNSSENTIIICGINGPLHNESENCIFEGDVYVHGDGYIKAYGIYRGKTNAFYGDIICESVVGGYPLVMYECTNCYFFGDISLMVESGIYANNASEYLSYFCVMDSCKNSYAEGDVYTDCYDGSDIFYQQNGSVMKPRIFDCCENCCYKGNLSVTANKIFLYITKAYDGASPNYVYGDIDIKTTKSVAYRYLENSGDKPVDLEVDSDFGPFYFNGTVSATINGTSYSTSSSSMSVYISKFEGIHTSSFAYRCQIDHDYIGTCYNLLYIDMAHYCGSGSWTPEDNNGDYTLQVLDKTTGEPLESAVVNIDGKEYTTDKNGIVTVSGARFAESLTVEADEAYVAEEEYYIFQPNAINTVYANVFDFDTDDLFIGNDASYTIQGPQITLAGKTFNLFELPFSFKQDLFDNVKIAYNADSRVYQVIVGNSGENSPEKIINANSEDWKETYNELKRAYNSNNPENINKLFSAKNTSFGVDCDANAYAFLQFSVTDSGRLALDEGGMIVAASASASRSVPLPPAPYIYLKFSLTGSIDAQAGFTLDRAIFYDPYVEASCDVTAAMEPALGTGIGLDGIAAAEAGLSGSLELDLTLPFTSMEECTKVILSASAYIQLTLLCFGYSYAYKFTEAQLYPDTSLSLASVSSLEDLELVDRSYINNVGASLTGTSDSGVVKTGVYPYGKVKTGVLSDGRVLVVWLDDDTSRNEVNKTALYYALVEDGTMSSPAQIYDDGTADYDFDLCVSGSKAAVAWQNSGSVLSESADLSAVSESINIVSSVFDGSEWSTPLSITSDTDYEYSPSIYYRDIYGRYYYSGGYYDYYITSQYIIWTQNDKNTVVPGLENAVESIYSAEVYNDTVTLSYSAEDIGLVYESAACGLYDFVYISDSDGDVSTTEKSLYYSSYGNTPLCYSMGEYLSGLYRDENGYIRYTENGDACSLYSGSYSLDYSADDKTIENIAYLTNSSENTAIVYEVTEGFGSELYASFNIGGYGWSDPVKITDIGARLRSWCAELNDDNSITVTAIAAEIDIDGNELNETTKLIRTDYTPDEIVTTEDTAIENLSVDSRVLRGETAEISFDVVNRTNSSLSDYTVTFTGEKAGVIAEKSYTAEIDAQDRKIVTAYVTIPDDFVRQNVTVSLSTSNENGFTDNDSITAEMGDDGITAEIDGENAASTGKMTLTLTNNGCTDLTNITVTAKDDYKNSLLSESLSSLKSGGEKAYTISVNTSYLSFADIYDSYGVMANISAEGTDGPVTADTACRVRPEAVSGITSDTGASITLKLGETVTPKVEIENADTAVNTTLYTSSDDTEVATVDESGTITAVGAGTAYIAYMPLGTNYIYTIKVNVYAQGDVDLDGDIDEADAALLLKYLSNIETLEEAQIAVGDYNNDGETDLTDTIAILSAVNS